MIVRKMICLKTYIIDNTENENTRIYGEIYASEDGLIQYLCARSGEKIKYKKIYIQKIYQRDV